MRLAARCSPAPVRSDAGTAEQGGGKACLTAVSGGQLPGYVRLEGYVDGPVDDSSPIYVQLPGGIYEASPVGNWENGIPFTLYVEQPECEADGCVLYYDGGVLCTSGPATIRKG